MIKFLNIKNQDKELHKVFIKDIKKIFINGDFILGSKVHEFEEKFAKYCGAKYSISCANGTDALTLALKSLNLPKESEVIIPAMTYCSTAFAVINANLKPVLVDIDSLKPTISIKDIKKKINKKTRVIIPVHLYGSCVNLNEIKKIVKNYNILIIDDCAQAHGGYLDSSNNKKTKKVGSSADISCFSFYPGKNLGAYGDGGIITTNNKKYYKIIRSLRNLGSEKKFIHHQIGVNSRLDSIQAAILSTKLAKLDLLNQKRKKIANIYNKKINNTKIKKLTYSKYCVYHQYVILVKNRNKLINIFKKNSIEFGLHYPYPIHKIKSLSKKFKKEKYINSEILGRSCFSLPIDPNLKKFEINKIINIINSY
jgi:dTDP-4-amino-4,6-dideoxygalactose transaminase